MCCKKKNNLSLLKEGEKLDYNKLFFNTNKKIIEKTSDKKMLYLICSLKYVEIKNYQIYYVLIKLIIKHY